MSYVSLKRSELRLLIRALHGEREQIRMDLLDEGKVDNLFDDPEYEELVRLQDKLIGALEKMPY